MSKVKSYVSASDTYTGGVLVKAGNPFVTDAEPGADWEEVTPKAAAAIEAATDKVPDDAQLDAASASALEAYALVKHVPILGADGKKLGKPDLLVAIKAGNEPKL